MVVGFTTTCAISEFEPRSWRSVLDTTLCDTVCQWLATYRWFSQGTPFSSTWLPRCNWNIVKSGVRHHKPNIYTISLY